MFARNKELREKVEQLKFENAECQEIANGLREQVAALKGEVKALENQIAPLQKNIRKQTEADLLLNALQAVGIAPKPEWVDHFARANELQSSLARFNSAAQQQAREFRRPVSGDNMGGLMGLGRGF
jgi:chromosome segregation ATPase